MKTHDVGGGCGLKPPCQSKIPIAYNVNTIAVPPLYFTNPYIPPSRQNRDIP